MNGIAELKKAEDRAFVITQALQAMLDSCRRNAAALARVVGGAEHAALAEEQAAVWAVRAAEAAERHDLLMYKRELAEIEARVADGEMDDFTAGEIRALRGLIAKLEGGRPRKVA